jgi:hypothetical protein
MVKVVKTVKRLIKVKVAKMVKRLIKVKAPHVTQNIIHRLNVQKTLLVNGMKAMVVMNQREIEF